MSNASPSDPELIERARGGDAGAFRLLVERHQRRVVAVALGMLRNRQDALDISQEAFLRVHCALANFDGESQFFTWLYRIVHNLCIDHLRRRRFEVAYDERDASLLVAPETSADPARALANQELRARFDAAMATLSPAHRAVLLLREGEGVSYQQIADVVGCSIGTVMSRLFHARRNLQKQLVEHAPEFAAAA
jgi:RNA polymerase sigma-70 factor (ECF subfamily)